MAAAPDRQAVLEQLGELLNELSGALLPGEPWSARYHFEVFGVGDLSLTVDEEGCRAGSGAPAAPTCTVTLGPDALAAVLQGEVRVPLALMTGRLKTSNTGELMLLARRFDLGSLSGTVRVAAPPPAAEPPPAEPAPPPAAAPAAAGPDLSTPQGRIDYLFERIPDAFLADKAGSWSTALHFDIGGAGDYRIGVGDGECSSGSGVPDSPDCVIRIDAAETLLGMVDGEVDAQQAFLTGKIKASNMAELMKFGQVFKLRSLRDELKAPPAEAAPAAEAPAAERPAPSTGPLAGRLQRLPERYVPDPHFVATIVFTGEGVPPHTLAVEGRSCNVATTAVDDATCTIRADADTLEALLTGTLDRVGAMRDGLLETDHVSTLVRFCRSFPAPAGDLNRDLVGKFYRGDAEFCRAEKMVAFAEATEDDNPHYVDVDRPGGIVAPPVFVMRMAKGTIFPVFTDPDLRVDLPMVVHRDQDMRFLRPLRPWDLVCPRANLSAIEDRDNGQVFAVHQRYYVAGDLAVEATSSFFVRSRKRGRRRAAGAPQEPVRREVLFEDTVEVAEDQPIRYGHASRDVNPIHMDDDVARGVGLPGKILQGLCTTSFCARAVVRHALGGDPSGLLRLKVRFSRYVLPGDTLTTSIWREGEAGGVTTLGFETVNQDGARVIRDGLAEVSGGQAR